MVQGSLALDDGSGRRLERLLENPRGRTREELQLVFETFQLDGTRMRDTRVAGHVEGQKKRSSESVPASIVSPLAR